MSTKMTVYVYTPELQRLREFYEGALGVKPADHGDWLPFALAGGTFALHGVSDASHDTQHFKVSIDVDDIEEAVARCEAHGAKVLQGVADEAFGKRAIIEDPDGRRLEIVQQEI